jgi:hypothetical protein
MRSRGALTRTARIGSVLGLALLGASALYLLPCSAQQIHRNSFETAQPQWVKGAADTAYEEQAHAMTDQGAHDFQRCEYLRVNARQGSHIHYHYSLPKAPVCEELNVNLWVKASRPGVQLRARVVLPNERDPNSLDDRLTTFIRGDIYHGPPGRWKRLELGRSVALLRQQQQLMQSQLGRPVNTTDAYIDQVVLNVYGGPGVNEVWVDALEAGPVLEAPPAAAGRLGAPGQLTRPSRPASVVEFNGGRLRVDNRPFFFRGIRHTDTPVRVLREAGFNTLFCEDDANPADLRRAAELGFWLVPHLPVTAADAHLTSTDTLAGRLRRFPEPDNVLFWELGSNLSFEQTSLVSRSAQLVQSVDPQRPLGGDAWDGLARYSGSLALLSVHRWPLMTGMEIQQYRAWLEQRRTLANPGTFLWSWVQTHTPEWYTNLLYERPASAGFTEPIGPQPEQIRLLTYTALGVGCRGLGFWSDRFLADSHQGRDRLLGLALLNQELEMLEPLLLTAEDDKSEWIPTSAGEVQAAVLRGPRGVLVLPIWVGAGSQYVPGQAAVGKLAVTVPMAPQSMQCWLISPGEVRSLRPERAPGGSKIVLPEFGLTAAVVFTSDMQLVVRFQELARARRQLAAQWTYDMAVQELQKIVRVHDELLQQYDLTVADAGQLLKDSRDRLARAKEYWDNRLFSDAYLESQRALRPARILQRALWDKATRGLDSPVASPYAVSFYTLGRHMKFMDQIKKTTPAANALPGGDFELVPGRSLEAWIPQEVSLDEVELIAQRVSEIPLKAPKPLTKAEKAKAAADKDKKKDEPPAPAHAAEGKLCLKLEIRPKDRKLPPPQALERTFLALNSPVVHLPPGSLVRISFAVLIPEAITASLDGAMVYDSAGGEPLALRLVGPLGGWPRYTLYRRVPASGTINVTLALTGIGAAYFDDVRIEPLVWSPRPRDYPGFPETRPVPVAAGR